MAQAPTQDFIVNSGLTVLGTSVVTSSTGNTSTLQVDGGAAVAKNLIVGSDAEIYGDLIVRGNLPFLSVTTGTFTNLTVNGSSALGISTATQLDVAARLAVGGLSQLNNATLSNQTNSTSSTTGALVVDGGVGIQKDLWVGGQVYVNGYQVLTTATVIASTLQAVTEQGSSTTVAISVLNTTSSTSTDSGALTVVGGVGIGGNLYAKDVYDNNNRVLTSVAATGSTYIGIVNLISTGTTSSFEVVNLGVQTLTAGTDTAVSANTGTVTVWNISTLQSVTNRGATTTNAINIANTTASTSTNTGALTVAGGVGIGGALYANKFYVGTSSYINDSLILTTATISNFAVSSITAGTDTAVSTSTGIVTIWNTSTLQSVTDRGATTTNAVSITNNTSANSTASGALQVTGGVGIGDNLYVGGTIYGSLVGSGTISTATNLSAGTAGQVPYQTAPGVTSFYGPGTAGNVLVSNGAAAPTYNNTLTLTSTLSNTTTVAGNALQVLGGVGIAGGLHVDGPAYFLNNVVFAGTSTSIFSTTTVYTDNYLELHYPSGPSGPGGVWTVDDGKDIGHIYHHYKDATGDEHGALIWHNASDELRWYMGGVDLNTATQVWDVTSSTFGVFRTGSILLEHTTTATSTTTGTLVVVGGVGIGGNLYVGGTTSSFIGNVGVGTVAPTWKVDANLGTITSGSISTGGYNVTGDATTQVGYTTYNMQLNNSTANASGYMRLARTASTAYLGMQIGSQSRDGIAFLTGAATPVERVRISAAGIVTILSATNATSTTTGALQVTGGVGIGGNLYVGGTTILQALNATSATFSGTLGVTGTSVLNGLQATNIVASGTLGVTGTSTLGILNATSATFSGVSTVTNATSATSTSTGALQVRGGVGIGGALYVQETSYVNGSQILTIATIGNFGVSNITAGTDTVVTTSTGAVLIYNTSTLQSITNRGAVTTNAISITNTTSSISTTTGALQVAGGIGVGDSIYVENRVGFVNTSNVSVVYQYYNAATNSLDTVFG